MDVVGTVSNAFYLTAVCRQEKKQNMKRRRMTSEKFPMLTQRRKEGLRKTHLSRKMKASSVLTGKCFSPRILLLLLLLLLLQAPTAATNTKKTCCTQFTQACSLLLLLFRTRMISGLPSAKGHHRPCCKLCKILLPWVGLNLVRAKGKGSSTRGRRQEGEEVRWPVPN